MNDEILKLAERLERQQPTRFEGDGGTTFIYPDDVKAIVTALRAAASSEPAAWHCPACEAAVVINDSAPAAEIVAADLEQVIASAILAHERSLSGSVGAVSKGEANRAARKAKDIAAAIAKAKGVSQPGQGSLAAGASRRSRLR